MPKDRSDEEAMLSATISSREETNSQSVGSYVSKEAAPIVPTPHNKLIRQTSPKSDSKELAEELSTLCEHSEDRVSKPGDAEARPPKVVKTTHKRFGIEDVPFPLGEKAEDVASEISSDVDSDSEDEAPETVTTSAGFNNARTAVLEATKVAARQEADRKAKRRERDQLLKSQAKASSKHKQPKEKPIPTRKTTLPTYLPASVLANSPPPLPSAQPPTLPASRIQKRKFLDPDPKPPKDLKRGNVKIRVLQEEKTLLPPKVSKNGRALREAWLMGRRQGCVVPRREAGWRREFVKK